MTRVEATAEKIADEVGLDPGMIVTVLLGLFSCLKDDDQQPTVEEQLAHAKEQVERNEVRVLKVARRYARKSKVPRNKIYQTAAAVVNAIKMASDEEIRAVCEEMK